MEITLGLSNFLYGVDKKSPGRNLKIRLAKILLFTKYELRLGHLIFFPEFSYFVPLPSRAISHARGHLRVSRFARWTTEKRETARSLESSLRTLQIVTLRNTSR